MIKVKTCICSLGVTQNSEQTVWCEFHKKLGREFSFKDLLTDVIQQKSATVHYKHILFLPSWHATTQKVHSK